MREQIVEKIKNAGVVGAGGAGFPTHVKVNADVDTVLVNGASCEPLLMSDPYLMEEELATMIRGLETVLDSTGAKKGIICLKGKHEKAMAAVRKAVSENPSGRLAAFELKDFYPAGDEQVLVREVLGRTVPEGGIPLQVGVVVSNVESLYNVALAMDDQPLVDRYVTVTGEVKRHMVVKVPVGSLVSDVIAFAGGPVISDFRVVDGGPMMGRVLPDMDQPVTKTTSGLIVLPPDHTVVARKIMDPERVRKITNSICCQCSQCTDLCPRNLLGHSLNPHKLMRVLASGELGSDAAREALLCSECGICEKFACPMMVSPREVNAQIKKVLMKEGIRWQGAGREPVNHPFRESRYVPTKRLMMRLNVMQYDTHPGLVTGFVPSLVKIPLHQHIGAPAICLVAEGDRVKRGDLIGEIPEKALGARIHASIDGVVTSTAGGVVTIAA
ncbi:RnfABCDGE-type electron transport complex C subunit [Desulfobotulus alkaliphilus]|uniref:RnfABCDGE-type electron transport complex C subunit n=1 Tax=Desulfobotulus alkaliphilus TaxID=622671 RepID=A0A562RW12_9BACT|nr:4Fe-4S dicluster domain-containing protein [Desulfobotulus alkaliphilus]TWI73013.1 RnfABCDGE-type electron transport complex C subunit [Desulfobotulus alkaliphilus]